jgi:hypothetical protein
MKIYKKTFSFIIVSFLFLSCKKEIFIKQSSAILNKTKIENITNPYDYLGEIHNIVLNNCLLNDNLVNLTNFQKIEYIKNKINFELNNINKSDLNLTFQNNDQIEALINLMPKDTFATENYYNSFLNQFNIHQRNYFLQLKSILNNGQTNYTIIYNAIKNLEQEVLVSSILTNEDRRLILGGFAIAKYSYTFWEFGNGKVIPHKMRPWLADIIGFAGGFMSALIINNNTTSGIGDPIGVGVTAGVSASLAAAL